MQKNSSIVSYIVLQILSFCLIITMSNGVFAQSSIPKTETEKPNSISLGLLTAEKFIPFTDSMEVNLSGVRSIQLTGIRRETVLTRVLIRFSDGTSNRLYSLEGKLAKNTFKQNIFAAKNGTSVAGLEIASFTPMFTGPRGQIKVNIQTTK